MSIATSRTHFRQRTFVSAIAGVSLAFGCAKKADPAPHFPPPEVAVVQVEPTTVPESYAFSGQVVAYRSIEVRARVDGIIEERLFTEGTTVAPGQLLYRLDRVRYDAAYRSALARFDNAKRTFERLTPLLAQHAVAQQDVDNARSAMEADSGALDQAKKDLDDTDVRAEIEGRIGRTLLDIGARVTGPANLLTTIDRLDPVYVTFEPSSEQLLAWTQDRLSKTLIRPGSRLAVEVTLPDGSVLPRAGRLDYVAPSLDAATGTQEFRATFDNPDRLLMPGQFVSVRLVGFARDSALAVPLRAVLSGMGRQFVYVVGPGDTAVARDVHPGPWSGNLWIIDRGLKAGDRVVVDGVQKVIPGRPVHPVPLAAGDSASARAQGHGE
jgi:membrane fusion protein (multidrug efflux system)